MRRTTHQSEKGVYILDKRDLQKRPTKRKNDAMRRWTHQSEKGVCISYKRDLQKRPTKETYKKEMIKQCDGRQINKRRACLYYT